MVLYESFTLKIIINALIRMVRKSKILVDNFLLFIKFKIKGTDDLILLNTN